MVYRNKAIHRLQAQSVFFVVFVVFPLIIAGCGSHDAPLSPELSAITTYTFGDSREPLSFVSDMVAASTNDTEARRNLERQFVTVLHSDNATLECKDFVCRQLWVIGSDISVPPLGKMLLNPDTADMARYALATNQSPRAGEALRNALNEAEGTILIGIINTLGERREKENMQALEPFLAHQDEQVADAARIAREKIEGMR